jgi:hypothetical protein
MRQAWTAKPRPQLKVVLQRLVVVVIIVVVRGVLHDDGVIAFADFSPLLGLGSPFLQDLDAVRGWLRLGDEHFQVILQDTIHQCVYSKQGLLD